MKKVDLRKYPKFWSDFTSRINREIDPSWSIPSMLVKVYLETWYGITVHVTSSADFGEVYMLDPEYTGFMLKWS